MRIGKLNISFYNPKKHRQGVMPEIDGTAAALIPFAAADLSACVNMIAARLHNAKFASDVPYNAMRRIIDLFAANWLVLTKTLVEDGFTFIDCANLKLTDKASLSTVAVIDNHYRMTGASQMEAMRPYLSMLDTVVNADLNLTKNYGALGILSPTNSSLSDGFIDEEERERMMDDYNRTYGTTFGKWSLLVTRQDVKFQPISLPVAALELTDKRRNALSSILQFLNIPKELHASFENAKYANRQEAERDMYANCVTSWAEFYATAMEEVFAKYAELHPEAGYRRRAEVWFDFVGVPALASSAAEDRERAMSEYDFWQKVAQSDDERLKETAADRLRNIVENL